jgi:glyoxylase-like metal-dependent hydrolase (beta-lactamase superfamily II)
METYTMTFSPFEVNTYIVSDGTGDCAIIDCSCYERKEFEKLENFIDRKHFKPVLLLNTHCHLDHIFGNRFMLERYNLGTFCNQEDEANRENAVSHAVMFGLSMEAPPVPTGFLTDGQKISFGTIDFLVLHVPGHSKGSLAFYNSDSKTVFTGDALFAGSIGRTDLLGGDHKTLINSIRSKLFTLPGETIVYPGHGERTTIKKEIETNPFFINT